MFRSGNRTRTKTVAEKTLHLKFQLKNYSVMDKFELIVFAMSAKLSALKKTLTEEQLKAYDDQMKKAKQSFLESHPSLNQELLDFAEQLFS